MSPFKTPTHHPLQSSSTANDIAEPQCADSKTNNSSLLQAEINPNTWETEAADRASWWRAIHFVFFSLSRRGERLKRKSKKGNSSKDHRPHYHAINARNFSILDLASSAMSGSAIVEASEEPNSKTSDADDNIWVILLSFCLLLCNYYLF